MSWQRVGCVCARTWLVCCSNLPLVRASRRVAPAEVDACRPAALPPLHRSGCHKELELIGCLHVRTARSGIGEHRTHGCPQVQARGALRAVSWFLPLPPRLGVRPDVQRQETSMEEVYAPPSHVHSHIHARVNKGLGRLTPIHHPTPPQRGEASRARPHGRPGVIRGGTVQSSHASAVTMPLPGGTPAPRAASNGLTTTHCQLTTLPWSLYPPTQATTNPSTALPMLTLHLPSPHPHTESYRRPASATRKNNTTHKPTEPCPLYPSSRFHRAT